ncbi:iron dicitrate transporter FecR [Methylomonas koyamae]|nr:iron dicitrate transporter FecR [Methylomonas koyamae]
MRADNADKQQREAFVAWLNVSPQHAAAWDAVQLLFAELEAPAKALRAEHAGDAGPTPSRNLHSANVNRRKRLLVRIPAAAAASLLLLAGVLQSDWWQNRQADYHTVAGEQRRIALADDSTVVLNTDTALKVSLQANQRRVELLRGEAYFQVAHAAERPFWVIAGDTRAKVTGTEFAVKRAAAEVSISVAEGRVETSTVRNTDPILALAPGQTAVYRDGRAAGLEPVDLSRSLAWQQGRIVFVQTPLAEAVEELNRYRGDKLVLTDPALARRPITAVFAVDRPDDAVSALEQTLNVRARRLAGFWVLLG